MLRLLRKCRMGESLLTVFWIPTHPDDPKKPLARFGLGKDGPVVCQCWALDWDLVGSKPRGHAFSLEKFVTDTTWKPRHLPKCMLDTSRHSRTLRFDALGSQRHLKVHRIPGASKQLAYPLSADGARASSMFYAMCMALTSSNPRGGSLL